MNSSIVCVLMMYVMLANARLFPNVGPFNLLDLDEKSRRLTPPPRERVGDSSAWSETVVIKMHYDCTGRLVRQEMSKLKTRAEAGQEGEEGSKDFKVGYSEGSGAEAPGMTVAPLYFRSMRERFKTPRSTASPWTPRPAAREQTTPRTRPIFEPDRIIDTPVIACPEGQNEDYLGRCRTAFPEFET